MAGGKASETRRGRTIAVYKCQEKKFQKDAALERR